MNAFDLPVAAYSLYSSSDGNSAYITDGESHFLIDAGRSAKKLSDSLLSLGASPEGITDIFVTHTHSDHVSALSCFLKKHSPRVHMTRESVCRMGFGHSVEKEVRLGRFTVRPFPIPHDCPGATGYTVEHDSGVKLAYATDMGCITSSAFDNIKGADAVFLESNYDEDMLLSGPYPYELKQRIMSQRGHLSNTDSARLLCALASSGTRRFLLCHISPKNNTPERALAAARQGLSSCGITGVQVDAALRDGAVRLI